MRPVQQQGELFRTNGFHSRQGRGRQRVPHHLPWQSPPASTRSRCPRRLSAYHKTASAILIVHLLGNPTLCAKLPVRLSTGMTFMHDLRLALQPVFFPHRQHICHLYPTFSSFLEKLTAVFQVFRRVSHIWQSFGRRVVAER